MLQYLLYVASSSQQAGAALQALTRIGAEIVQKESAASPSSIGTSVIISHRMLGEMQLQVQVLVDLGGIIPILRQCPVDLLIYDERGEGAIPALRALGSIRADVEALALQWGPDFHFPMSRVVAILAEESNESQAFALGRSGIRDVLVRPRSTTSVLHWIRKILTHGVVRQPRVGMAFSGGGVEGFLYQIGTTYALSRAISGLEKTASYSGISSGSIIATAMAMKTPLNEIIRALYGTSKLLLPLKATTLFDLAAVDIARRITRNSFTWPGINPTQWLQSALRSIPTGFFKGDGLRRYVNSTIQASGRLDSFSSLPEGKELFIGATDQDSFNHKTFGMSKREDVPISTAVQASCSLPPFFMPVSIGGRNYIDGQITRTCNIELLVERGCRLIIIVDPMQPLPTQNPGTSDNMGGMHTLIQSVKSLIYSRFRSALAHVTERYPDVDFMVFQPTRECAHLMSGLPMRYRIRTQLVELAYRTTLRQLRQRHHVYSSLLGRFGLKLASEKEIARLESRGPSDLVDKGKKATRPRRAATEETTPP